MARQKRLIDFRGGQRTFDEIAEMTGIPRETIRSRVREGWTGEMLAVPYKTSMARNLGQGHLPRKYHQVDARGPYTAYTNAELYTLWSYFSDAEDEVDRLMDFGCMNEDKATALIRRFRAYRKGKITAI